MGLFGPPNIDKMKAKRDIKGLVKAMEYQKDAGIRKKAAEALGELRDIGAVDPLIAAFKDTEKDVRWVAANAVGKIGDARAVEPLIAALQDIDNDVRKASADALILLYQSNLLDKTQHDRILAQRGMKSPHHADEIGHYDLTDSSGQNSDCRHSDENSHTDEFIGVTFQV